MLNHIYFLKSANMNTSNRSWNVKIIFGKARMNIVTSQVTRGLFKWVVLNILWNIKIVLQLLKNYSFKQSSYYLRKK